MAPAKKFFVIWAGVQTGVFPGPWERVRSMVDGYPSARYKGYMSEAEAQAAYAAGNSNRATAKPATSRRPAAKRTTTSKPPLVTANGAHADSPTMQIYADGACNPNPGPAGTGLAVYEHGQLCELWYGLSHKGTNNTAELQGLEHALIHAKQALALGRHQCIQILTDSKYSLDSLLKWMPGWQRNGWKRDKNAEVKNLDIMQRLFALYHGPEGLAGQLSFKHVRGHAGIEGNELADRMAAHAIATAEPDLCRHHCNPEDIAAILAMPSG